MKKITDLEEFVLYNVYLPYQNMIPGKEERKEAIQLNDIFNLENAIPLLFEHKEWRDLVIGRILKCGFFFPPYINHPLVNYIKNCRNDA